MKIVSENDSGSLSVYVPLVLCSCGSLYLTTLGWRLTSLNGNVHITQTYANSPMQYAEIFKGCKMIILDDFFFFLYIFHIFAQNIDCGYTFEPPQ